MKKNIIWLASYPKSGNTWFRIFLSNLFSSGNVPVNINDLLFTPIASKRSIFDYYAGIDSADLTQDEIDILRPKIFKKISSHNKNDVFIKVHDAWRYNSKGKGIFPVEVTKGVIYIIRNPLDVAVSYAMHNNATLSTTINNMNSSTFTLCSSTDKLHYQLSQRLLSWSDHVLSWTNVSTMPVHILKYEDMIQDSQSAFSSALQHIGLDFSLGEIENAIENSSFHNLQMQENEFGFKEKSVNSDKFFRSGNIGSWAKEKDLEIFKRLISKHNDLMKQFDYIPTSLQ